MVVTPFPLFFFSGIQHMLYKDNSRVDEDKICHYSTLSQRNKTLLALRQTSVVALVFPVCKHHSKKEVTYEKHVKKKTPWGV